MSFVQNKVTLVTVSADEAGQRIDNYLLARLKGLPKSRLYRLLRKGEVRVNKGRVKPEYKVDAGDLVRIPPVSLPDKGTTTLAHLPKSLSDTLVASVLYEDDKWLVVDKPAGLAVHGGSGQSFGLIEAMRLLRADCRYLELCHRIDRDTSGCLVMAKKRSALRRFHAALREKKLIKRYMALVAGRWPAAVDAVNVPLEKNVLQSGERMVCAGNQGKKAQTLFEVKQKFENYTLIQAQPVTGRTHQIRVHARSVGHAIVGDSKYGEDSINNRFREAGYRQLFLHAASITVPKEVGNFVVQSEMPESWQQCFANYLVPG